MVAHSQAAIPVNLHAVLPQLDTEINVFGRGHVLHLVIGIEEPRRGNLLKDLRTDKDRARPALKQLVILALNLNQPSSRIAWRDSSWLLVLTECFIILPTPAQL